MAEAVHCTSYDTMTQTVKAVLMKIPAAAHANMPRANDSHKRHRDTDQPCAPSNADDDDDEDYHEAPPVQVKQETKPKTKQIALADLKALWTKSDLALIDPALNQCTKYWSNKGDGSKGNKLRNALFYHTIVGKISWEIFQQEAVRHGGDKNFQLKKSMHDGVSYLVQFNAAALARIKDKGYILP